MPGCCNPGRISGTVASWAGLNPAESLPVACGIINQVNE